ncbi:MAG: condensation domain-containing protein, partial [Leptolyngbyaceae cyanobacterium MO_188.B28]|nr:condensation domain-containing protein [Leptolyngbyaceae cyanobacterium MO_188.B28]
ALPALNRLREAANRPQGPTALADKLASGLTGPAVSPIDRNGSPIALSFAQQRLWFLNQLQEGNSPYNVTLPVRLTGNLDVDRLERAVREIVQRHEILRTRFPMIDGAPCQVIDSALPATLPVTDLQELPEEEKVAQLQQLTLREIQCSFDLANGPLLRFTLLRLEEQSHVLIFNYHHIIFDGWSIGIFLQEIATLYAASSNSEASPLPKLPIQYADFAHWQRQWLQGEVLETHLNYWRQQLAGAPSVLELPTDRPRPAVQTFRGGMETIAVDAALTQSLKALSQQAGTTLFMTLLAAFATLLARYSGQDDILVGSPIANRTRPEIKPLIGFFANTLVLRIQMQGNPTFEELLNQVRQVALDSYVHQDLPFEKLVEELQPQRSLTLSPLFQVMFVFQNAPIKPLELPELTITPINNQESSAKFDITLSLNEKPEGLSGFVNYNADLFEAPTIALMVKRFQTLLNAIVSAPQQPLSQLSLLSEAEQSQLLQGVKGFATATAASLSSQETGSDEGGIDHLLAELEGLSEEDAQRLLSNEILT